MFSFLIVKAVLGDLLLDTAQLIQTSSQSYQVFDGKLSISSFNYGVDCDCNEQGRALQQPSTCHPTKIKLSQQKAGKGTSYDALSSKLASSNFTYSSAVKQSLKCLDGRVKSQGIQTPGGDAGQFILGLLVYQDLSGKELDFQSIEHYFTQWLRSMSADKFYMCTDDLAVAHLERTLGAEFDIRGPRQDLKESLLSVITRAENIGDSHLKLMVQFPQLYSINPRSLKLFLQVFFKIYWEDKHKLRHLLQLDVLDGLHQQTAYLQIRLSAECLQQGSAPLLSEHDRFSVYINQLDAASIKRREIANFFAQRIAKNRNGITTDKFYSRMNHHGLLFLDVTGEYIASNLPFYTAVFV